MDNLKIEHALKAASTYIEDHCHQFVPVDRQSTFVPKLLREAISEILKEYERGDT